MHGLLLVKEILKKAREEISNDFTEILDKKSKEQALKNERAENKEKILQLR